MCLFKKNLQSLFTAPGHQPPAPLSSPLHPRNASWNSKPAEPWRSQRFREISFIYFFMICIYSSWYVSWYSYSGVGSKMPARKKKSKRRISIQSFVDKLSDDGGQPLRKEAFWTSMRILWTILQKLPSSERIGRLHSENIWKYVKMLMLRSDPHSRRPSTAMEAWQQHDLLHPLFQGRRALKCVKRHFRDI